MAASDLFRALGLLQWRQLSSPKQNASTIPTPDSTPSQIAAP
ncbi:hypothetical protein [Nocardioides sp. InS609-2]|nr:hypothetical protein [Nocardioides sp. InS609-2]